MVMKILCVMMDKKPAVDKKWKELQKEPNSKQIRKSN
jgi:hypothetical protein